MANCCICGRHLKNSPEWKTKCHDCWKKTELKGKNISELLKKYSDNSISNKTETDYKMGTNRRKKWGVNNG